jgi:hypothetical protein
MENFSWIVFLLVPIYVVVHFVRNYFALRGRDFPGPCLAKFTNLWRLRAVYRGNFEHVLYDLHLKHGDVVRIGPRCLSISDPAAIEGIYGVKTDFKKVTRFPGVFLFSSWAANRSSSPRVIITMSCKQSKTGKSSRRLSPQRKRMSMQP